MATRIVVIGVGNALRGDDGAGLAAVARIPARTGVERRAHSGEGIDLLELWAGADAVVIIDAVVSGARPGTILRFDASREPIPTAVARAAGHAVGVAEAIELARSLGRLPRRVILFALEGERFGLGDPLSEPVQRGLVSLADAVAAEVRRLEPLANESRERPARSEPTVAGAAPRVGVARG